MNATRIDVFRCNKQFIDAKYNDFAPIISIECQIESKITGSDAEAGTLK